MHNQRPFLRRLLLKAALILVSLLLCFGLGEIYLRVVGFEYPSLYRVDRTVGGTMRPNASGWWQEEGHAYVNANNAGFHDSNHDLRAASNTFRIAILGDSYVEALQVPFSSNFCSVIERELNQAAPGQKQRVEVLNFGMSGFGTDQELLLLRSRVRAYAPNLIVLAFLTGNDVQNNSKELEPDHCKPFFSLQDGKLVLDESFLNSRTFRVKSGLPWRMIQFASDYSRMVQLLNRAKNGLLAGRGQAAAPQTEAGLDLGVYRDPPTPAWAAAWSLTETLILAIRDEARTQGADLLVVTLSNGIQVQPDRQARDELARKLGITNLLYPDERLERFCQTHGLKELNLAPRFQAYATQTGEFLHGFANTSLGKGHWNERGHALAGRLITEKIRYEWLQRPASVIH